MGNGEHTRYGLAVDGSVTMAGALKGESKDFLSSLSLFASVSASLSPTFLSFSFYFSRSLSHGLSVSLSLFSAVI